MKPTIEELLLQILSTCLLINGQGKWDAHFNLAAHVGWVEVRIHPSDTDYEARNRTTPDNRTVIFTSTTQHPHTHLTDANTRQNLSEMLAWAQEYLSMEAAA